MFGKGVLSDRNYQNIQLLDPCSVSSCQSHTRYHHQLLLQSRERLEKTLTYIRLKLVLSLSHEPVNYLQSPRLQSRPSIPRDEGREGRNYPDWTTVTNFKLLYIFFRLFLFICRHSDP